MPLEHVPTSSVQNQTVKGWVEDFEDKELSDAYDEQQKKTLRATANEFLSINDPKLRNSQLFELLQQFGSGDVTIEGNAVRGTTPAEKQALEEADFEEVWNQHNELGTAP